MIQNTVIAALFAVATLAAAPVKVDLKDAMGKPVGTATISEAKTRRRGDSYEVDGAAARRARGAHSFGRQVRRPGVHFCRAGISIRK